MLEYKNSSELFEDLYSTVISAVFVCLNALSEPEFELNATELELIAKFGNMFCDIMEELGEYLEADLCREIERLAREG